MGVTQRGQPQSSSDTGSFLQGPPGLGCSVTHIATLLQVRVEGDPQPQGIRGARMGFWFAMNHVTYLQSDSQESDALETVSTT